MSFKIFKYKFGIIFGFVFGAVIAPFLGVFGLISAFIEILRPVLMGGFDLINILIPNIQKGENSYSVPFYKWIVALGFNGILYGIVGGFVQYFVKKRRYVLSVFGGIVVFVILGVVIEALISSGLTA